jgi:monothiol glutaredoxin
MTLKPELRSRIASMIESAPVVLFMKGNREQPQCGFSAQIVQILDGLVGSYQTYDVLRDAELRDGIKEFSDWPTIPQLYIKGEFQGGCDIVTEMYESGELHTALGVGRADVKAPTIHISDAAAEAIRRAGQGDLHLVIDARFKYRMGFGPRQPGMIEAQSNGVTVLLSLDSARRADGLRIDASETPQGPRISIDNPNEPRVEQIDVRELKRLLDSGTKLELIDVRTEAERARAAIPGAQLLDAATHARLEALPKDTKLVFHCHHGGRSQAAAEHFASRGFVNVHNLAGGIDAWSRDVDPSVPRY